MTCNYNDPTEPIRDEDAFGVEPDKASACTICGSNNCEPESVGTSSYGAFTVHLDDVLEAFPNLTRDQATHVLLDLDEGDLQGAAEDLLDEQLSRVIRDAVGDPTGELTDSFAPPDEALAIRLGGEEFKGYSALICRVRQGELWPGFVTWDEDDEVLVLEPFETPGEPLKVRLRLARGGTSDPLSWEQGASAYIQGDSVLMVLEVIDRLP